MPANPPTPVPTPTPPEKMHWSIADAVIQRVVELEYTPPEDFPEDMVMLTQDELRTIVEEESAYPEGPAHASAPTLDDTTRLEWLMANWGRFRWTTARGSSTAKGGWESTTCIAWTAFDRYGASQDRETIGSDFRDAIDKAMDDAEDARTNADFNRNGRREKTND